MLTQLKKGDRNILKKIYQLYFKKIFSISLYYTHDKDLASDIVQEVFIKIWRNREHISETLPIEQQLFVITKNIIFDYYKRKVIEEKALLKYKELITLPVENYDEEIKQSRIKRLHIWVSKLPKQQQVVFKMHKFEGLTYQEISDSLNISINTVSSHIASSMRFLKKNLVKNFNI